MLNFNTIVAFKNELLLSMLYVYLENCLEALNLKGYNKTIIPRKMKVQKLALN